MRFASGFTVNSCSYSTCMQSLQHICLPLSSLHCHLVLSNVSFFVQGGVKSRGRIKKKVQVVKGKKPKKTSKPKKGSKTRAA